MYQPDSYRYSDADTWSRFDAVRPKNDQLPAPVDKQIVRRVSESVVVGEPKSEVTTVGPLVSRIQFDRVEGYIAKGIAEGARLVVGGPGQPTGCDQGYFVHPTVFSDVRNNMTIAREEIFGPVLCVVPYDTEEQAIAIANDTPCGLAAYVWSADLAHARKVGSRIRAGQGLNGVPGDMYTPLGGFNKSGNGREWGVYGLKNFLEVKAPTGAHAD